MAKKKTLREAPGSHPAFVTGIVTFDFWNNNDESYRDKALRQLAKEIQNSFNISALPIHVEHNPESGKMAFAAAATNLSSAEKLASDVMKFIDAHAPARMVSDNWIAEEFPE